jgi:hypothetical protein
MNSARKPWKRYNASQKMANERRHDSEIILEAEWDKGVAEMRVQDQDGVGSNGKGKENT